MDWKQLLGRLAAAGLTQVRIAELCDVSQSTISDLNRGVTKSPSFELGTRLRELDVQYRAAPGDAEAQAVAGQGA